MSDMRKLMESVASLFESPEQLNSMLAQFEQTCAEDYRCYGNVDAARVDAILNKQGIEAAAEEMAAAMSDQDGGESPDEVYEIAKDMLEDYMAEHGDMGAAMAHYEDAEPVVEANITQAIDELHDILGELEQLGEQARNIVRMIDRGEAERLDAYGAFDFGSSKNRHDTTLASFVEDLESGGYDGGYDDE